MSQFVLAIHGGAGTILKSSITPQQELAYRKALDEALSLGEKQLAAGIEALDVVEAVVRNLEDNELFNAGRGAVFTNEGKNELDASIMDGKTLMAGAVTGVRNIKNPVSLARTIMERSGFVFLSGKGAEDFAKKMEVEFAPDEYFYSEYRYQQLMAIKNTATMHLDHKDLPYQKDDKFGTVGAVVLDLHGNLAAATSTGGMTNKKYGRIGDSPVIGSGTYANNHNCAVSCTGYGEFFLRCVVSYDVACLMEYKGLSLQEACDLVVNHKLVKLGGEGGLVAVDSKGHSAMVFNSEGMYRGMVNGEGKKIIGIYKDLD